ncbi:MAG: EcsC family protein [Gammaproteobacteria bacterium]
MAAKKASTALTESELDELRWAYRHLEHPSLAGRLSNVLAFPIEEGIDLLPKQWQIRLHRVAERCVYQSLSLATGTLRQSTSDAAHLYTHKLLAMGTGAVGGFFGPLTLLAELPLATAFMLRAIAAIAQHEGEDLSRPETKLACAQVFALGGRTREDDAADLGYYGLRIALGLYFEKDIIEFAASAPGPHIPAVIQIVRAIAARFGVVISDKVAAQMVPVTGAASGALINLIFMNHYQSVARGHFIVRRLERQYDLETVKRAYGGIRDEELRAERDFSPVDGW